MRGIAFVLESLINPKLAAETLAHLRRREAEYRSCP